MKMRIYLVFLVAPRHIATLRPALVCEKARNMAYTKKFIFLHRYHSGLALVQHVVVDREARVLSLGCYGVIRNLPVQLVVTCAFDSQLWIQWGNIEACLARAGVHRRGEDTTQISIVVAHEMRTSKHPMPRAAEMR
jgi:hypothetical protein